MHLERMCHWAASIRIRKVLFFLANPKERHTLYLDRVGLE